MWTNVFIAGIEGIGMVEDRLIREVAASSVLFGLGGLAGVATARVGSAGLAGGG